MYISFSLYPTLPHAGMPFWLWLGPLGQPWKGWAYRAVVVAHGVMLRWSISIYKVAAIWEKCSSTSGVRTKATILRHISAAGSHLQCTAQSFCAFVFFRFAMERPRRSFHVFHCQCAVLPVQNYTLGLSWLWWLTAANMHQGLRQGWHQIAPSQVPSSSTVGF